MKCFVFVSILFITGLFRPAYSAGDFTFDADYCSFKSDQSNKIYLELYYAFSQEEMKVVSVKDGFEIKGKIMFDLYSNAAGKNVIMKDFYIPLLIKDTSGFNMHSKLTGQINFLIDTGSYKLVVKACDFYDTSRCSNLEKDVILSPIPNGKLSCSPIQLASSIVKSSDENNIFYKNTLEVTPNPSCLFGNNLTKIYYYLELYNLKNSELSENYSVEIRVSDKEGKDIKKEKRQYKISADSKVEYGTLDINDVPSAKYYLSISVLNDKESELLKTSKEFWIVNSSVSVDVSYSSDLEKKYMLSEYPKMTEEQLNDEFEKSIYFMTDKNRDIYNKLVDVDRKKLFMFSFWNVLDPNQATIESEFKTDYFKRVEYSNKNFKNDFREGWKTDRGRVYCIYGKYDEIERHTYEGATRAYEIWTFNNLQSGVIFVFVDESAGYGNYVLVHSTAQNEISDDKWRDKLNVK